MTFFISDPNGASMPYMRPDNWARVERKSEVGSELSGGGEPPPDKKDEPKEQDLPLPVALATEVMQKKVVTISDKATLAEALAVISRRNIRQIPVITGDGKLVGLLSEKDLLDELQRSRDTKSATKKVVVRDIMTRHILCARPFAGVREIAHVFFDEPIHSLPIVDEENHVIGIITRSDLLHTVMKVRSFNPKSRKE